jgi:hypothetical protein
LAGIAPNDLRIKVTSEVKAEIGFPNRGRTDNDRDYTWHNALSQTGKSLLEGLAGICSKEYENDLLQRRRRRCLYDTARGFQHDAGSFVNREPAYPCSQS